MYAKHVIIEIILICMLSGCELKQSDKIKNNIDVSPNLSAFYQLKENEKENMNDTLILSMHTPIEFNPLKNSDPTVASIMKLIFEPLVNIDHDGKVENNLIEEIIFTGNTDESTANIKLKKNIKWSDDSNLTADDVLFSLDQIKEADENTIYKSKYKNIISYGSKTEYDLYINFRNGVYTSVYLIDFPIIQRRFFLNEYSNDNLEGFVSSGPYKICSYTRMKYLQLVTNEKYFGVKPLVNNIKVIITPDIETDVCAFNQQIIDLLLIDPQDIGKFYTDIKVIPYAVNNFEFILLNPNLDETIHKLLINVIPRVDIKDKIYMQSISDCVFNVKYEEVSLEEIKKNALGYETHDITILVNKENTQRIKTANLIQKELEAYGINSCVEIEDFNTYLKKIHDKKYDIIVAGLSTTNKFSYYELFDKDNPVNYDDQELLLNINKIKTADSFENFTHAFNQFNSDINKKNILIILGVKNVFALINNNKNINIDDVSDLIKRIEINKLMLY